MGVDRTLLMEIDKYFLNKVLLILLVSNSQQNCIHKLP